MLADRTRSTTVRPVSSVNGQGFADAHTEVVDALALVLFKSNEERHEDFDETFLHDQYLVQLGFVPVHS